MSILINILVFFTGWIVGGLVCSWIDGKNDKNDNLYAGNKLR